MHATTIAGSSYVKPLTLGDFAPEDTGGSKGVPVSTFNGTMSSDDNSYDTVMESADSGNKSYAAATANTREIRSTNTRPMDIEQIRIMSECMSYEFFVADLDHLGFTLKTIDEITRVLKLCNPGYVPDLACPLAGRGRLYVVGYLKSRMSTIDFNILTMQGLKYGNIVWKFMGFADFYNFRKKRDEENAKYFYETVTLFGYPNATLSDISDMFKPFGAEVAPFCTDVKQVLTPSGVWNLAIRVVLKIERGKSIPGYIKVVLREKTDLQDEFAVNVQIEASILRGSVWCRLCCGEGHKAFVCPLSVPDPSDTTQVPQLQRWHLKDPKMRNAILSHLPRKDFKALKDVATKYEDVTHFGRSHNSELSILSNQSLVDITVDGKVYKSNEHYALSMLAKKSEKFGFLQDAIESSSNVKLLIKNAIPVREEYTNNVGEKELLMFKFLKQANMAKYSQNSEARAVLLRTAGTRLAESVGNKASPFWSTCKSIADSDADNVKSWEGSNVMGDLLTVIRDGLSQSQKRGHSRSPSGCSPSEQKLRSDLTQNSGC